MLAVLSRTTIDTSTTDAPVSWLVAFWLVPTLTIFVAVAVVEGELSVFQWLFSSVLLVRSFTYTQCRCVNYPLQNATRTAEPHIRLVDSVSSNSPVKFVSAAVFCIYAVVQSTISTPDNY